MKIEEIIRGSSIEAIGCSKELGFEGLDYSVESLAVVDSILESAHLLNMNGEIVEENLIGHLFGGYIIEVIVRDKNISYDILGITEDNPFSVNLWGHRFNPAHWCMKRIANGNVDNVWFKYQVIVRSILVSSKKNSL